MAEVTPSDLDAIGDVADWLADNAEYMGAEQAIIMLEAARVAERKLRFAIELLQTQAMRTLEQPILIGSTTYEKRPTFKKRPDQTLIARVVVAKAAAPDENGEVPTAHEAATAATEMMAALYVSPKTKPKTSGVQLLGLSVADVTAEEHTGTELRKRSLE